MASFVYDKFAEKVAKGEIDMESADWRILLVGSTTTADTERDKEFLDDFSTLGELAGSGNYVRKTLASVTLTRDDANHRVELDCADITWTSLTGTPSQPAGAVLYIHDTDDTDAIAAAWIDGAAWNSTNGSNWVLQINAEGLLQLAC